MTMFQACRGCGEPYVRPTLSLGALPVCNRFAAQPSALPVFPLDVGACRSCGLVQLTTLVPTEAIRPLVPWIRYNEPDGHLDEVADHLAALTTLGAHAVGIGPFDAPLLQRLAERGLETKIIDARTLIEPDHTAPAYLETYQAALTADHFANLATKIGRAEIVLCRYLLEHSHEPRGALEALGELVTPDGHLIVEVPDSSKFLDRLDYSFLWEEHVVYFVEETLSSLANYGGFTLEKMLRYPGAREDALVAVLKKATAPFKAVPVQQNTEGRARFERFAASFEAQKARRRELLERVVHAGGRIALIGIGHQAIMFANAFGLQGLIACAVDDDSNKRGSYAPGFSSKVISISELDEQEDIDLCLTAFDPRVLPKILAQLPKLVQRKARFTSIFPSACLESGIGEAP